MSWCVGQLLGLFSSKSWLTSWHFLSRHNNLRHIRVWFEAAHFLTKIMTNEFCEILMIKMSLWHQTSTLSVLRSVLATTIYKFSPLILTHLLTKTLSTGFDSDAITDQIFVNRYWYIGIMHIARIIWGSMDMNLHIFPAYAWMHHKPTSIFMHIHIFLTTND